MRIVSGKARGRKLKEISGNAIMPTSDLVKESVFNIIQFDVEGRGVLDLFAGTGQLGIEALSRGAKSVEFVDSNPAAIKIIKDNLVLCGFSDAAAVHMRDAIKYLQSKGAFDLIFIDPPYDSQLLAEAMASIVKFDKLNHNGIIICETSVDKATPIVSPPYCLHKEYRYGGVKVIRYDRKSL